MSYVDAFHQRDKDIIHVVERDKNGKRIFQQFAPNYTFYFADQRGKYRAVDGTALSKFSTNKRTEFQKELRLNSKKKIYEGDINPVFRCLEDNYLNSDVPKLHTCFFDIEVDFDQERGFAPPEDPFNKVTAITMYLDWANALITLCIPPKHMSDETAQEIASQFENTYVCNNEIEMFNMFFDIIEDSDVLTGWNSSGFDIPYMINRIMRVMSRDDTRRLCLWNQHPKKRKYMRFDQEQETYDLIGRVHMDYLELYKKYNYESRHSYKLDSIGELEVGETKTAYEGTLDQLYNKDFKKFLEYNRQDTMLLFKIHDKLKFLDLACSIAHQNTVLLQTAMGSVALIEQAVINEAHERGLIVPNKQRDFHDNDDDNDEEQNEDGAVGAYVAYPKKGMHEWIAAVDLNSLYPSTIRALNMAPETIVGQLRPVLTDKYISEKMKNPKVSFALAWEGVFGALEYTAVMNQERGTMLTIDWESGGSDELSAAEAWKLIFDSNQPWILSANGTIFTHKTEGVIPGLLTKWYSERKDLQKKAKSVTNEEEFEYYDKRQLVRKILLNSAYGALLNKHCRFYDKRIGQSTTLTGRQIVKHMSAYLNEAIVGEYDHVGDSIIYNDTDSAYFTASSMLKSNPEMAKTWNKDVAIEIYDQLGEAVNNSFPEFMERAFHCPRSHGEIIKAGREIVADRGIFVTKKKYAVNVYDKEGKRKDTNGKMGDVKVTGLDIKRSDTPKFIQEFLMKVLTKVLAGEERETIIDMIREFKEHLRTLKPWDKGSPKGVKKLSSYEERLMSVSNSGFGKLAEKINMPGHTRASVNWNYLRKMNSDNYTMKIVDGMKIVVCKLKDNPLGLTSIAYPVDETRLPEWFKELPFDDAAMEQALVDEKIENIIGVLNWKLRDATNIRSTFENLFSFE